MNLHKMFFFNELVLDEQIPMDPVPLVSIVSPDTIPVSGDTIPVSVDTIKADTITVDTIETNKSFKFNYITKKSLNKKVTNKKIVNTYDFHFFYNGRNSFVTMRNDENKLVFNQSTGALKIEKKKRRLSEACYILSSSLVSEIKEKNYYIKYGNIHLKTIGKGTYNRILTLYLPFRKYYHSEMVKIRKFINLIKNTNKYFKLQKQYNRFNANSVRFKRVDVNNKKNGKQQYYGSSRYRPNKYQNNKYVDHNKHLQKKKSIPLFVFFTYYFNQESLLSLPVLEKYQNIFNISTFKKYNNYPIFFFQKRIISNEDQLIPVEKNDFDIKIKMDIFGFKIWKKIKKLDCNIFQISDVERELNHIKIMSIEKYLNNIIDDNSIVSNRKLIIPMINKLKSTLDFNIYINKTNSIVRSRSIGDHPEYLDFISKQKKIIGRLRPKTKNRNLSKTTRSLTAVQYRLSSPFQGICNSMAIKQISFKHVIPFGGCKSRFKYEKHI